MSLLVYSSTLWLLVDIQDCSLYVLDLLALCCRFRRVLGLCYVAVKVSLLVVMEIGFFPLICGWWLDICSLVSLALL